MPPLADLQQAFAHALLAGAQVPAPVRGCLRPDEAMRIHRNTVMSALAGALRLSHPTVDALVGEAFFDQAACAFAQSQPPRAASLSPYGGGFAEFLSGFAPCADLPYLADVARLDFTIDRVLQDTNARRHFALDATVAMALPCSLTVLALRYPADEIRAAIGDDKALAAIALEPVERHVLVWRHEMQARLRPVGIAAGRFLRALLAGTPAQEALDMAGSDHAATLAQLQADVFATPFCSIVSNPQGPPS